MNTVSRLTITAFVLLLAIIVFGKSLYTDVIWIGVALIGVVSMVVLHLVEASEQSRSKVLSSIPRLILGATSLIVGVFCLEPLYSTFVNGNPRGIRSYQVIVMVFISGLFLFAGFSWVRKAMTTRTSATAQHNNQSRE